MTTAKETRMVVAGAFSLLYRVTASKANKTTERFKFNSRIPFYLDMEI